MLAPRDDYTDKIQEWGVLWFDTPVEGTGANPIKDFVYFKKLHKIFKDEKPDAILSFTVKANIYASLAGKLRGIPVICNVSGLGTVFLVKGFAGKIAMVLYRIAFRFSAHVFFQNGDDQKLFTSHIKIEESKLEILPGSGINLDQFKPIPLKESEITKFVMVSRIIVEKGVREYAEAASNFVGNENVIFTLVGAFDEEHSRSIQKSELDRWISEGWIDYQSHSNEIDKVMIDHDVVVLPSYREGTSRTLLEGAALGRPLITTDVPGCRDVVRDGFNGFLCEVQNAKSLLDKLNLFLSLNRQERAYLATNSRMLVEETYDERIVIDIYDKAIRRIIT